MENVGTQYFKTFQKIVRGFRSSTKLFSYTTENMIMPSTTVSLGVGENLHIFIVVI